MMTNDPPPQRAHKTHLNERITALLHSFSKARIHGLNAAKTERNLERELKHEYHIHDPIKYPDDASDNSSLITIPDDFATPSPIDVVKRPREEESEETPEMKAKRQRKGVEDEVEIIPGVPSAQSFNQIHFDQDPNNNVDFSEHHQSDASDQFTTHSGRTTGMILPAASVLHVKNNVNAGNGTFNAVGGDQYNSITTNIDHGPERREFGDWASPLNFKLIQNEIFQTHEAGTGEWLLESKEFMEWHDGQSETLWCRGIPGSGKTVLASIIINYLLAFFKDRNVAIVYIYCNYKEQTAQTVPNLIASLLRQLVQDHDAAYDNVKLFYKHHRDQNTRPTLDEFRTVIRTEAERFSKVFVVVDALDECSEVDGTRANLLTALRSLASNVSLLVTSRDLPSIAEDFDGTPRLDIHANDEDVRKYIEGRIPREPRLAIHVKGNQTLQEMIVKTIIGNVRGMFLLARLHIDSLATAINRWEVRKALEHLPQELSGTYDEAMKRIEGQVEGDRKLAERVFSWISYAYRQLSLEELRYALAVSPGMTQMEPDALVDETILMSVCAGLVVIDQKSNLVRLVHYTTQEYFERIRALRFPHAQVDITESCVTYLSFDVFTRDYCRDDQELEYFLKSNPLLEYAARYWGRHAQGQAEENMRVRQFLQDYSHFPCVNQVLHVGPGSSFSQTFPRIFFGIHVSSYFGLAQTIEYQLQNGAPADSKDSHGQTPLSLAAEEGHEAVVKMLLMRDDVDVNSEDDSGQTALSLAAVYDHEAVAKLLLARDDVDVNREVFSYTTVLSLAAEEGHEAVVDLLLARDDVDINSKDYAGQTALSLAAKGGHKAVVKLLLARDDVDVNSKDKYGYTPLSVATKEGHEAVVDLLLALDDVDMNSKDDSGRTALSLAAEGGREAVAKLLLAWDDADVNSKDDYGYTPLSVAAKGGHEAVAKLLLAQDDADVNSKDMYGRTPLSLAARMGHEAVVKLLLARDDVDVNPKDSEGNTPLFLAAWEGQKAVVDLLLTHNDVDVNPKGDPGQTQLSLAVMAGQEEVMKLLLERDDIDVNSTHMDGRTLLSFASGDGFDTLVELVLARDDVDVNSKDNSGRTPLSWAACKGNEAVVKLLLARDDVDVNSKEDSDETPLAVAAKMGHEAVVKLLLAQDYVDVNPKDWYYQTPLSLAAEMGHEAVVKLLLARDDVDVNWEDYADQTALSLAATGGHEAVAKLLLAQDDVDVNSKDSYGSTPLSLAARMEHEAVVKLLVARDDVDVNLRDHDGHTPLWWVFLHKSAAVGELLLARDDIKVSSDLPGLCA